MYTAETPINKLSITPKQIGIARLLSVSATLKQGNATVLLKKNIILFKHGIADSTRIYHSSGENALDVFKSFEVVVSLVRWHSVRCLNKSSD